MRKNTVLIGIHHSQQQNLLELWVFYRRWRMMLVHLNTGINRGEHEKRPYIKPSWSFGSFIKTKPYFKWNIPVITVNFFGIMTCMIDCDVLWCLHTIILISIAITWQTSKQLRFSVVWKFSKRTLFQAEYTSHNSKTC